jgi:hypothetical protein
MAAAVSGALPISLLWNELFPVVIARPQLTVNLPFNFIHVLLA